MTIWSRLKHHYVNWFWIFYQDSFILWGFGIRCTNAAYNCISRMGPVLLLYLSTKIFLVPPCCLKALHLEDHLTFGGSYLTVGNVFVETAAYSPAVFQHCLLCIILYVGQQYSGGGQRHPSGSYSVTCHITYTSPDPKYYCLAHNTTGLWKLISVANPLSGITQASR